MRQSILDVLQKMGMIIPAFFLLSIYGSEISSGTAADKSLASPAIAASLDSNAKTKDIDPAIRASIEKNYAKLPLSFEANHGQVDDAVKYLSRGSGYTLFLSPTEAVVSLRHGSLKGKEQIARRNREAEERKQVANDVIQLKLIKANPNAKITGLDELPGKSNYLIGNDPAKWHTDVSNYAKVKIEDVYPGIDLVYYGNQRQLEYDWIVNPGADPKAIRFAVQCKSALTVDAQGDLILDKKGELRLNKPFIYQQHAGSRTEIAGKYKLLNKHEAGFQLDKYDASLPLVIDPVLSYSTYLGGSDMDFGCGIAVDSLGNAYVAGSTSSTNFPTANPLQASNGGGRDVFVTKLNASGNALVYSTYLGGSGGDYENGIVVDSSGNAYVTGSTDSINFPTENPLQAIYGGGGDAFVTKLNASGNRLIYSTYLGGSSIDSGGAIAVDSSGNAYVTGNTNSADFPTALPFQAGNGGGRDVFVAKLRASGSGLVYSTYIGGSSDDFGEGIAVDFSGNAYVTGQTASTNFPMANALQVSNGGSNDAFVTKLNVLGSALVYSTYLGGNGDNNGDFGRGIAVDSLGDAYVTGYTSSANFPTANPLQASNGGGYSDAFVAKLNAAGNALVYSTYLGGSGQDIGFGIAIDSSGNAYVTGYTGSTNFPTVSALQAIYGGGGDVFVTKLNASGNALVYSTYLGGGGLDMGYEIAVDFSGKVYVTGNTDSINFPTANSVQASNGGGYCDAFVAKISFSKTFADFDGDELSDLAGLNSTGSIFYTTDFVGWTNIPGTLSQLVVGDFDGDGRADLAGLNSAGSIFYTTDLVSWTNIPGTLSQLVVGDSDGDGLADLAGLNSAGSIFYTTDLVSWTNIPGTLSQLVVGDFDGDGRADLAGLNSAGGIFYMTDLVSWTNIPGALSQLVVGDFDGDGIADLAGLNSAGNIFYTTNLVTWTNIPGTLSQLVVGDFDGDGLADLAGLNSTGNIFYTTDLVSWTNIPGTLSQLVVGDFDGGGLADLAGLNSAGSIFYTTDLVSWTNIPGVLKELAK